MAREPDKFPPGIYLVSTPIGNLEDISERQRRVLEDCDVVACEDTRRTGQLLARLSIKKSLLSYHEHNESARAE
ncbi:MAG: 16S rRNA (cytidine(1402)-2'-O)-methyltransferase, partial [Nitrospinaceae bacterium]|nr:16S rRNA (cytidine(1402)-2'-O)-methyltransferase [Nitrospinaceae bacterium]